METQPIFILGVPRSGTTLLRTMLDSHPNIAAGAECPWISGSCGLKPSFKDLFYALINGKLGPLKNFKELTEELIAQELAQCINGILQISAQKRGKKRWAEKTPNHMQDLPFLHKLLPEAKYIHIIRDGRDVACSSFKLKGVWWGSLWIGHEKNKCSISHMNALKRWRDWILLAEKEIVQYQLNVHTVQYEHLIRNPKKSLKDILLFIGEDWSDELLNYSNQPHSFPDWEVGSHDVAAKPKLENKNIGLWKTEFNIVEKLICKKIADPLLVKLGYEPTSISHIGNKPLIGSMTSVKKAASV